MKFFTILTTLFLITNQAVAAFDQEDLRSASKISKENGYCDSGEVFQHYNAFIKHPFVPLNHTSDTAHHYEIDVLLHANGMRTLMFREHLYYRYKGEVEDMRFGLISNEGTWSKYGPQIDIEAVGLGTLTGESTMLIGIRAMYPIHFLNDNNVEFTRVSQDVENSEYKFICGE